MNHRRFFWLGLAACTVSGTAFAQAPNPPPYLGPQWSGLPRRPCPNDAFVVEAPLWGDAFASTFRANLQSRLNATLSTSWFCPVGETCFASNFWVNVIAVLPDYTSTTTYPNIPSRRRDGHRRFYRVEYWRRIGTVWSRTQVLEDRACSVVSRIRTEAAAESGLAAPSCIGSSCSQNRVLVSRECFAAALDVEGWLTSSQINWSFDRIKASSLSGLPSVDVALVDTGVPFGFRAGLGVLSERSLPGIYPGPTAEHHPHGAHMAALIRRVSSNAQIYSYRALDQNGVSTISSVAHSIDSALFPSPASVAPRRPLIINLSLGFPRELTQPSNLSGTSCNTWEDGLGESVRYVLDVAADLDATGPPVIAVAAGGNSILERFSPSTGLARGTALTPCGTDAAATQPSAFFPAALGSLESCRTWYFYWYGIPIPIAQRRALPVVPIGATDFRDLRSALTLVDAEPYLHAPGERVYASHEVFPAAPQEVACDSADVGLSHGFESPAAVSGTSASAALVTGSLARVLAIAPERAWATPWRGAQLARLAFLSGVGLCEAAADRTRLEVERFQHAATSQACFNLRTCVASTSHPLAPIISGQTKSICGADVASCFAAYPNELSPSCSLPLPMEEEWPSGHLSSLPSAPSCTQSFGVLALPTVPSCTAGPCAFEDQQLSGLRSQPVVVSCPGCSVSFYVEDSRVIVFGELSDGYPAGTIIQNPYLVLLDENKNAGWLGLESGRIWRPGEVFSVESPISISTEDLINHFDRGGTVALDVELIIDGRPSRSISPLAFRY